MTLNVYLEWGTDPETWERAFRRRLPPGVSWCGQQGEYRGIGVRANLSYRCPDEAGREALERLARATPGVVDVRPWVPGS